eukprot:TRINITY_DN96282_c0_g1_i1.p1 TRINITY_DN96282_c0_g1~~TRINITY_DN96282_c0_g1_i1.p1  ORF type:complete len:335 (+),score=51.34 TRINITY_DN96282_c0_g1_i1:153-1157(+)
MTSETASAVAEPSDEHLERLAEDFAKRVTVRDVDEKKRKTMDDNGGVLKGTCKCGACSFHFYISQVLPAGHAGLLDMVNCHCERCRRAHAAAFATYVTVRTSGLRNLRGKEVVRVRTDTCGGIHGEVFRAFCGSCFSSLATFPKVGREVHISAGCLDVGSMHVENFVSWCRDKAAPYLDFVPSKRQRQKARQSGAGQTRVTGGCACGNCSYVLLKLPEEMQHCYCGQCRLLSGAAFQTWMPVEEGLSWTRKETRKLVRTTEHARRHVCTSCGVFMTIVYDEDEGVWPLAGSLDDCYTKQDLFARTTEVSHICVKYKQSWWKLPDDGLERVKDAS